MYSNNNNNYYYFGNLSGSRWVDVYKALDGLSRCTWQMTARLLSCHYITGRRRLRSSNMAACEVATTHTSLGDRSFTVAGRRLPLHVILSSLSRSSMSVAEEASVLLTTVAPRLTVAFWAPYTSTFRLTLRYIMLHLCRLTYSDFLNCLFKIGL